MEDEEGSDCITLGSDDLDVEEINKDEVKTVLKELAELRRKEADRIDRLAQAVPEMRDNELVIVSEKMQGMAFSICAYDMYERIGNARNFRAYLVAGECLLSIYKHNQAGANVKTVPDLCHYFNVGKTKLYEILQGEKYGKEEEAEKKPPRCIKPEPMKKKDLKKEKEEEKNSHPQRNP